MNTPDPRAEARNRANRRLRRMTIGTTVIGIAATGALGLTAAMSYDGGAKSDGTIALVTTQDSTTSSSSTSTTSTATSAPSTSGSSATSTATTPTVTSGSGTAHASTGGS